MYDGKMTIEYMTGVIDMTRGDADTVRDTVIIHDIVEDRHSIIAYDFQIEEILAPHVNPDRHEEEPDFSKELSHAWHWQEYEEAESLRYAYGFSIEYFKDFLEENSGEWTYPEGLNHKFTRTRPHIT